jgi:para-nitrobenzyl esterase
MDKQNHNLGRRALLKGGAIAGVGASLAPMTVAQAAPAATAPLSTPVGDVVQTVAGKVRGYRRDGVHVFEGVPYAESPAGANRSMPPV